MVGEADSNFDPQNGIILTVRSFLGLFLYLSISFGETCAPAERLQPVDSLKGVLSEADCRLSDGTFYKDYLLTLPVRGVIQLDLNATNGFDGTILLRNEAGSKAGAGSSIHRTVESGVYHVLINALQPGQTGDFSFRSGFTPEPGVLCSQFGLIGAGQTVAGRLTDAGCRLPDGSAFDGYRFRALGAGTLTVTMQSVDFNAYLILRTDEGRQLAFDDNSGGGTNASFSAPVNGNQIYTIIAAAATAAEKAGGYAVSVNFSPDDDETCRPLKTLSAAGRLQGNISGASCQFTLPGGQGMALFDYYDLRISTGGAAGLKVTNAAFQPELTLLDASGNAIASDLVSGGRGMPAIRQQVAPGAYKVQVFDPSATGGDYTLQFDFQPGLPELCPILSLASSSMTPGGLSAASCRAAGGLSDVYRIELASAGTLDIALASADFDTLLILRDDKDNFLNGNDDTPGSANAHLTADLPAGVYSLAVVSNDFPGAYTITSQFTAHDIPTCVKIQDLNLNSAYRGYLSDSSCHGRDGRAVDYYRFTLPADGTAAAIMTSVEVDSLLTIEDAQGNIIRSDDNSFGQGDALIQQFLPAGAYRIGARAAGGRTAGFYRLDLLFAPGDRPAGCKPASALMPGDRVNGRTNFTSCRYPDNTFAEIYRLDVKDAATAAIELTSADFAGFLLLLDSKGNLVDHDDSGGPGNTAGVTSSLDPGAYYLVVKPAADPSSVGSYTLQLRIVP